MTDKDDVLRESVLTTMHRRNTRAVEQQLMAQDILIRDQQIQLDNLGEQLSSLFKRMNALEQEMGRVRATRMGTGPTQ